MEKRTDWLTIILKIAAIVAGVVAVGYIFTGNISAAIGWGAASILWGAIIAMGKQGLK